MSDDGKISHVWLNNDWVPVLEAFNDTMNRADQAAAARDSAHRIIGEIRKEMRSVSHDLREHAMIKHLGQDGFDDLLEFARRLNRIVAGIPRLSCEHCHDDPPDGHVCPRCGRPAENLSRTVAA